MVYLWIIIRDFFVQYIFGGYSSEGISYTAPLGWGSAYYDGVWDDTWNIAGDELDFKVGYITGESIGDIYLTFSDWLSSTATIITLVALLIGISALMISLFKWIVRLVSLRG